MKIALAQIKPFKGDIAANIIQHKKWINLAIADKADLIIFPELSITGYEPTLAKDLATIPADSRFDDFQQLSNQHQLIIGIGAPIESDTCINISLLLFHPNQPRQVYSKKYLHVDELPFFESGQNEELLIETTDIALAICYELSVPDHFMDARRKGAKIYLASVAKTTTGVQAAGKRLKRIAATYSMFTLMVNSVGYCDNFESAGQSAIWEETGNLLGQLTNTTEGLLFFNTDTRKVYSK